MVGRGPDRMGDAKVGGDNQECRESGREDGYKLCIILFHRCSLIPTFKLQQSM